MLKCILKRTFHKNFFSSENLIKPNKLRHDFVAYKRPARLQEPHDAVQEDTYGLNVQQDGRLGDEGGFLGLLGCVGVQALLLDAFCFLIVITAKQVDVAVIVVSIFHLYGFHWGSFDWGSLVKTTDKGYQFNFYFS